MPKQLSDISIVLVEPKIAGNIGATARLCNNFGVKELILVNPQADFLSDEAIARAMHSVHYLQNAIIRQNLKEVKADFDYLLGTSAKAGDEYHIYRQPVVSWELDEVILQENGRKAIVFGREDSGLKTEELKMCDFIVHVDLPGEHNVLNLSHSIGIILYEILRTRTLHATTRKQLSTRKEKEVLFDAFKQMLNLMPYEDYRKPIVFHTFKKVINRSAPSSQEIHALIGIFKALHKIVEKESKKRKT